jgi:hypothetical protein
MTMIMMVMVMLIMVVAMIIVRRTNCEQNYHKAESESSYFKPLPT